MSVLWLVVLTALFGAAQALLFAWFNYKQLSYNRYFAKNTAFRGEQTELIERIRNEKLLPVPWLRAESRIPEAIVFSADEGEKQQDETSGMYHKSLFFLSPMCAITRHHMITLAKRGVFDAGGVALTVGDLFGLNKKTRLLNLDCSITVYPELPGNDDIPDPANKFLGDALVKRWIMPDPFLVSGIRPYAQGDSLKDIHWKASAKSEGLQVKVRDFTSDPKALVILNIQINPRQWAQVPTHEEENVERAISLAAGICLRAIKSGMSAGFACNAEMLGREKAATGIFLASAPGEAQFEGILETMARIVLKPDLNFHTFLSGLGDVHGEDILILSGYLSEEVEHEIALLRQKGNTVKVLSLSGREIR
ncbi:MAG: DUF58 domain-containing protein [Clostridia bacterium]|nr:DUF58 domain-containing protein [Clostridia bacterium]